MAGAFASAIYQGLIRRNAVYLTTIFASAFAFELTFDTASNKVWDSFNRGVRFFPPTTFPQGLY
ncbi:hypothetical protein ALUC_80134S [Aspergillus luchuensis]|nr:hypothetical protein ALUC_80134S [Aspergillus luchuensis]